VIKTPGKLLATGSDLGGLGGIAVSIMEHMQSVIHNLYQPQLSMVQVKFDNLFNRFRPEL
jgi:hypothetical protein